MTTSHLFLGQTGKFLSQGSPPKEAEENKSRGKSPGCESESVAAVTFNPADVADISIESRKKKS